MTRTWHTSTHSGDHSNCVQVSLTPTDAQVRDSKNTPGPPLAFTPEAWRTLITRLG